MFVSDSNVLIICHKHMVIELLKLRETWNLEWILEFKLQCASFFGRNTNIFLE